MNNQGPKLSILYSCVNCSFYDSAASSVYPICNKLGKRLSLVDTPDEKCPFISENTKLFCENKIEELNNKEIKRIRKVLDSIFPKAFNLTIREDKIIFTDSASEINSDNIKKLTMEFPELNWKLTISDSYNMRFKASI